MVAKNALADVSKSRVNRAGEILRLHAEDALNLELDAEELAEQRDLVREFRRLHGKPTQAVASNLRYYVREQSDLMIIGKRLKRVPTIIDKLTRYPEMNLARMHDIGGCRAVLKDEQEVRSVATRLEENWSLARPSYDYITHPKEDGYRAIHLVVLRHCCRIEVQLRTMVQHGWAELIERIDRERPMLGLKAGRAHRPFREYYALGAQLLADNEDGRKSSEQALDRFRELNRRIFSQDIEGRG